MVTYLLGINRCEFDYTLSVVTTHQKRGDLCRRLEELLNQLRARWT